MSDRPSRGASSSAAAAVSSASRARTHDAPDDDDDVQSARVELPAALRVQLARASTTAMIIAADGALCNWLSRVLTNHANARDTMLAAFYAALDALLRLYYASCPLATVPASGGIFNDRERLETDLFSNAGQRVYVYHPAPQTTAPSAQEIDVLVRMRMMRVLCHAYTQTVDRGAAALRSDLADLMFALVPDHALERLAERTPLPAWPRHELLLPEENSAIPAYASPAARTPQLPSDLHSFARVACECANDMLIAAVATRDIASVSRLLTPSTITEALLRRAEAHDRRGGRWGRDELVGTCVAALASSAVDTCVRAQRLGDTMRNDDAIVMAMVAADTYRPSADDEALIEAIVTLVVDVFREPTEMIYNALQHASLHLPDPTKQVVAGARIAHDSRWLLVPMVCMRIRDAVDALVGDASPASSRPPTPAPLNASFAPTSRRVAVGARPSAKPRGAFARDVPRGTDTPLRHRRRRRRQHAPRT